MTEYCVNDFRFSALYGFDLIPASVNWYRYFWFFFSGFTRAVGATV